MKVAVIGAGDVGAYLCRRLLEEGNDVTLIESDPLLAQQLDEEINAAVRIGNGASAELLHGIHVESLDFFFAMTQNDQVNILACSIAKRMGAKQVVARIHDNTYADYSYLNYQSQFGIDLLVNPEALAAGEIAKHLRNPGRVAVENFGRGEIEVQQMRVSQDSVHVDKSLQEIRLPDGLRIAYLTREGQTIIPTRETIITAYAMITLVGNPQKINDAREVFKPEFVSAATNVVICGATETAISLLKSLSSPRFKIKIFEPNLELCEQLAERFPRITIIHGPFTSLRLLEEENVALSDHFIACSKTDEQNIMACLQAKKLGTKHLYLLLNKADYEDVVGDLREDLGLVALAAPRLATADELLRFMCTDSAIELAKLPDGSASFYEVRIQPDSVSHNREVCEISMPAGCVLVALLHKFQAKVPSAHDRILAGDRLILIANPAQKNAFMAALL